MINKNVTGRGKRGLEILVYENNIFHRVRFNTTKLIELLNIHTRYTPEQREHLLIAVFNEQCKLTNQPELIIK